MLSMVEYVHQRLKSYPKGNIGIDMTMGNGHDTLELLNHCQEVYAFDIQQEAINHTKELINNDLKAHLVLDGHQNFDQYIESFDYAIFNLGYLPGASHIQTTMLDTTKEAIIKAVNHVNIALWIVVYPGHDEGYKESLWINEYVASLDTHLYNVSQYSMLNKNQSPYVIEIEKR